MIESKNYRQVNSDELIRVGSLTVNKCSRTALLNEENVALTAAEFDLLWFLAQRAGQTVSRDELYNELIKTEYDGLNRCLDLRVSRLRKKLGNNSQVSAIIKSI